MSALAAESGVSSRAVPKNPASDTSGLPLDGLIVLDLSHVLAGPYAGMVLGDLGASVIKVEHPRGEDTRHMPPVRFDQSMAYQMVNRNKESLTLDLSTPQGVDAFKRMVKQADIVIENFRVGTMAKLGLDYATLSEINPGLVMASISGFGQTGPYAGRKGLDLIAQAMSGIMSITGEADGPPVKCGIPVADLAAGLYAMVGILAAIRHRDRTGIGQFIDTSLFEVAAGLSVWQAAEYFGADRVSQRWGSSHALMIPYGGFKTQDGHIVAAGHSDRLWPQMCELLELGHLTTDARFSTVDARLKHRDDLQSLLDERFGRQTSAHWLERLERVGIPAAPIQSYDAVFSDPHLIARGMLRIGDDGSPPVLGNPLSLSATPWRLRRQAPRLSQDSDAVLRRFGFAKQEISELAGTTTPATDSQEGKRP